MHTSTGMDVPGSKFDVFAGKSALITGGLGFIGSSLAIALAELGCRVQILDALIPEYGGNWFNIAPIDDRVDVTVGDIRDEALVQDLVCGQDYIFHSAAQVSHVMSLTDPFPDIDINIRGTAILLEACRNFNPQALFVKLGTRGQYGPTTQLPVNETADLKPRGVYELSLLSSEQLTEVYHRVHGIPVILLRLTNIYGPRAQMKHSRFGVANWFLRLALDGKPIPVFGDGSILRDFLYIDDCVEAILNLAAEPAAIGEVFNVGSDQPSSFRELAETIVEQTGGTWHFAPFTRERSKQEPGDYYSCIDKIRSLTGWQPQTSLEQGVRQTLNYYRQFRDHYWEPASVQAVEA